MSRRRKGGLPPGKLSLTGACKRLGIDRDELIRLVNAGEIPYHRLEGHSYIDEATVEAIASRALDARLEALAEAYRAERRGLMASPLAADKQIRLRTGLDDHLELGEYKPEKPRQVPPGPVTRTRLRGEA